MSVPSPCGLLGGRGKTQDSVLNIKSLSLSILKQSFPHLQDQYAVLRFYPSSPEGGSNVLVKNRARGKQNLHRFIVTEKRGQSKLN